MCYYIRRDDNNKRLKYIMSVWVGKDVVFHQRFNSIVFTGSYTFNLPTL